MIDWLYQSTLDISLLIVLIILIRNPMRRFLGAHISYWLWSLPLLRLIFSNKFERPDVITKYLSVPEANDLIPVYTSPLQSSEGQIELLTVLWILGFSIWSLFKLFQGFKFKALLRQYAETIPEQQILSPILAAKFKARVRFKQCSAIQGPLISGLCHPTVYLPPDFFKEYDVQQQHHIIEHELTHAQRKDLWAQLMAEMFKAVFWFNPLVHMAWLKFQQDQELACDHQVLKHADSHTRYQYGVTLSKGLSALLTPNSLTFFNHRHERFIMLNKHKNNHFTTLLGLAFIVTISFIMLTKPAISFAEKNKEKNGIIVSFEFNDIPLSDVAVLISNSDGTMKNLQGLDLLRDTMINVEAKEVHAFDFFDKLLNDHGFMVDRQGETWQFHEL